MRELDSKERERIHSQAMDMLKVHLISRPVAQASPLLKDTVGMEMMSFLGEPEPTSRAFGARMDMRVRACKTRAMMTIGTILQDKTRWRV